MKNIDELINGLSTIGRRKTHKDIWAISLFYYASIMLSRYKIQKDVGTRKEIIFYSIFFAGSGVGKSYSLKKVESMFNLENYPKAMMSFYERSISLLPDTPSDKDEIIKFMPKSATSSLDGTKEGLYQIAYAQSQSNYGSLNLFEDE